MTKEEILNMDEQTFETFFLTEVKTTKPRLFKAIMTYYFEKWKNSEHPILDSVKEDMDEFWDAQATVADHY